MKILDLNIHIDDIDGSAIDVEQGQTLGKLLARSLVSTPRGDAFKHWDWAVTLNAGKPIALDSSDMSYLRAWVLGHEGMAILVKIRLVHVIDKAKEDQGCIVLSEKVAP